MKTDSRDHSNNIAEWLNIDVDHFARLFGVKAEEIPADCKDLIKKYDFHYRALSAAEHDRVVLDMLKRIDSPTLTVAGKEGKERWVRGWNENLEDFKKSGYALSSLVPKFVKPDHPVRFEGNYVMPRDAHFELNYFTVLRRWLLRSFLEKEQTIYEFGCGTGYNLAELAALYPEKELHGLDWVPAPKEILRLMAEHYHYKVTGHIFDMLEPDESLKLKPGSAVLAIGALEQIGTNFEAFLQYILKNKPTLFVQLDSILEWYKDEPLTDYIAAKFDRRRKYLEGYWPRLQELEKEGKIEILKAQRSQFGGLQHDGYSLIVWRPK